MKYTPEFLMGSIFSIGALNSQQVSTYTVENLRTFIENTLQKGSLFKNHKIKIKSKGVHNNYLTNYGQTTLLVLEVFAIFLNPSK